MELEGNVNNINLDEFISTAILNNVTQVFENVFFVENLEIKGKICNF